MKKAASASALRTETQQVEKCSANSIRSGQAQNAAVSVPQREHAYIHASADHLVYGRPLLFFFNPYPCLRFPSTLHCQESVCTAGRSFCMSSANHKSVKESIGPFYKQPVYAGLLHSHQVEDLAIRGLGQSC